MKRPQYLTRRRLLVGCGVALTLAGAIALGYGLKFTGFGADETVVKSEKIIEKDKQGNVITEKTVTTTFQNEKKLWDWVSLLLVPLLLALLAWWLQQLQQKRAEVGQREEAVQTYFDRISMLLVDKNLFAIAAKVGKTAETELGQENTAEQKEVLEQKELLNLSVDIIRARTFSILRQLKNDPERKTNVIQFLLETGVIRKLKIDLSFADLSRANLTGADLSGANLTRSTLWNTHLFLANLTGVNLSGAYLGGAYLSKADFSGADLSHANLSGAILIATDLREAVGLTKEQLEGENAPLLCNVGLPKGTDVKPDRDCAVLPKVLLERYPEAFKTLEAAKAYVDEGRKKQWD